MIIYYTRIFCTAAGREIIYDGVVSCYGILMCDVFIYDVFIFVLRRFICGMVVVRVNVLGWQIEGNIAL